MVQKRCDRLTWLQHEGDGQSTWLLLGSVSGGYMAMCRACIGVADASKEDKEKCRGFDLTFASGTNVKAGSSGICHLSRAEQWPAMKKYSFNDVILLELTCESAGGFELRQCPQMRTCKVEFSFFRCKWRGSVKRDS
ncbi:hypothetical protein ACLOJK_006271 [Asimina triloba]